MIHLPGGGQCYDEESCQARWEFKRASMSSSQFTPTKAKKGFLDSALRKTPFYGAHKAMLGYCSSDGYMGDVGASAATVPPVTAQPMVASTCRVRILRE